MPGPTTPDAAPVTLDGVRYEALKWGKERDLGQNGGLIAAHDAETGAELWVGRVYAIRYGDMSPSKYDRFITEMRPDPAGGALLVTDDHGGEHRFDLASRTGTPLNAAAEIAPEEPPPGGKGLLGRLFGR